ncbi:MAG: ATP-grasp domain-containing protein [Pseudomonadota bacterium]
MTHKTVLLTLGRLPKALELARGFHALGCRVLVAEPHAWHVCRLSRNVAASLQLPAPNPDHHAYASALRALIERENVDHVVPVSEEAPHVLAALADSALSERVYSPSADTVAALHHKFRFARDAIAAGHSVPDTLTADDPGVTDLAAAGPTVLKPIHGCSGEGVQFFEAGHTPPALDQHIVQRRIDGRHVSSFSILHEGRVHATALYEGTLMSGTVAVCFRRVDDAPEVHAWIEQFAGQRSLSGFVSFDFIVDAQRTPWAIECNPRTTSGTHFLEPADIARAVLAPGNDQPVRFREKTHFQQFYPALTEAYSHVFRPRTFLRKIRPVLRARDVVFDWRDLKPFLLMTPASWPILRQTLFEGKSFGAAATADIVWTPPSAATPASPKTAPASET